MKPYHGYDGYSFPPYKLATANFCQVPVRIAFRNPEVAAGFLAGSFVDFGGEGVWFNCEWSRVFKLNKIKIKEHIDFSYDLI